MYQILRKQKLNENVTLMDIEAPLVANKGKAGQFIILRVDEEGERIPLTIAGTNPKEGSVTIIFQIVGLTTYKLNLKNEKEFIHDFVGPLGNPTDLDNIDELALVAGGVGVAIALPILKEAKGRGIKVHSIIGFRNKDLVILEDDFKSLSDSFVLTTDDGSMGIKGNVTMPLDTLLKENDNVSKVITIGPLIMMKYVALKGKEYQKEVTVSMNPIMIDGTGMCGGCRLSLIKDGKKIMKFACADGPDFNGLEVDFDETMKRNKMYQEIEKKKYDAFCNLMNKKVNE